MSGLPLTAYDFFGYVVAGGVTIAGVMIAVAAEVPGVPSLSAAEVVAFVVGSYILGHAVAVLGVVVVEGLLLHGIFGRASVVVLGKRTLGGVQGFLAPRMYRTLPAPIERAVSARARREGFGETDDEAVRVHCLVTVRRIAWARERLDLFTVMEHFCRNTAAAFLVVAVAALVSYIINTSQVICVLAWFSGAAFVIFFARFGRFAGRYYYELYAVYAGE